MFGKLTWARDPLRDEPIPSFAGAIVIVIVLGVLAFITLIKGWVPYLWREWITSVDHKRIGVMYVTLASVMLLRGFIDAIMMRSQQALAFQSNGYLPPDHYNQIFSAHGTIMIFFVAMPFVIGLMNIVVPLQLGVRRRRLPDPQFGQFLDDRDRRAPRQHLAGRRRVLKDRLAAVSAAVGADLLARRRGRLLLVGGADLRDWHVADRGDFVTTILEQHAPGMTYMRMPVFCWTALATSLLLVAAFPVLTATLAMLNSTVTSASISSPTKPAAT